MDNFDRLKNLLIDENIHFNEGRAEDDSPYVLFRQPIENAGTLTIIVGFSGRDQSKVSLAIYNIAKISSPLKRDELLRIVNQLNIKYSYIKFVADDEGEVSASYHVDIDENYDFGRLLWLIVMTCKTMIEEDAVKQFMKLQWA